MPKLKLKQLEGNSVNPLNDTGSAISKFKLVHIFEDSGTLKMKLANALSSAGDTCLATHILIEDTAHFAQGKCVDLQYFDSTSTISGFSVGVVYLGSDGDFSSTYSKNEADLIQKVGFAETTSSIFINMQGKETSITSNNLFTVSISDFEAKISPILNWYAITVDPLTNDVYAAEIGGAIYKQTAGVGSFVAQALGTRNYRGSTATPGGTMYFAVRDGTILTLDSGGTSLTDLYQTSRYWSDLAVASNGDVYATVSTDDIYVQTGGSGNFVALGIAGTLDWTSITAHGDDMYACVSNGDIYKQTNSTGNFEPLLQTSRNWMGMTSTDYDVYACVYGGDIYKMKDASGNFEPLLQTSRNWFHLASQNNSVFSCVVGGNIYKATYRGVANGELQYADVTSMGSEDTSLASKKYVDDKSIDIGGTDTQIQYNDNDVLGGSSNNTFTSSTGVTYIKELSTGAHIASVGGGSNYINWRNGSNQVYAITSASTSFSWQNPYTGWFKFIIKHQEGDSTVTIATTGYWPGEEGPSAKTLSLLGGTSKFTEVNVFYDGTSYYYDNVKASDTAVNSYGTIKTVTTNIDTYDNGTIYGDLTINWSKSDIQEYQQATNTTLSFIMAKATTMLLKIKHDASSYTVTFPDAYNAGVTGKTAKAYTLDAGATKVSLFNILYDGTDYYISQGKFYA